MQIISSFIYKSSLVNQLKTIDLAIKDVLKKNKLGDMLNTDTNFAPMLYNLSRKYINNRLSDDTKYDIMMEAFEYVFLKAMKKDTMGSLRNFTGEYNGNFITIEQYIAKLMTNAVINANKAAQQDAASISNRQDVNPIEDETFEQAVTRIMNTPKIKNIKRADDIDDEIGTLEDYIAQLQGFIKQNKKTARYSQKTIEAWENKIEKMEAKIKELQDSLTENVIYLEMSEQEADFTAEEELLFNELTKMLEKKAKKSMNQLDYERTKVIISMLINGYNKGEIARKLKISSTNISFYMQAIKKLIKDYAEERHFFDDDNSLLNSLKSYSSDTLDIINRRYNSLNDNDKSAYELFAVLV